MRDHQDYVLSELTRIMRRMTEQLLHDEIYPEYSQPDTVLNLVTFVISGARYAVPLEHMMEVFRIRPTEIMPTWLDCIGGVIVRHNERLALVDFTETPHTLERGCERTIIVLGVSLPMALEVDHLDAVMRADQSDFRPAYAGEPGTKHPACTGVLETRRGSVILLDPDRLFTREQGLEVLMALAESTSSLKRGEEL